MYIAHLFKKLNIDDAVGETFFSFAKRGCTKHNSERVAISPPF